MTKFKSDFLRILSERGFIHQMSDETGLDDLLAKESVTAYIGYDPTASSLHVGHLMQIMMLRWFQQTGHQPISLMGGGTGMVGDPSFKEEARKLMTIETIEENIASIKSCFSHYLDYNNGPKGGALMINNAEWLRPLNYLEFLRDVGRHFSVNRMLSFDSVKTRLDREQSLSFLEFNYMILQAYDFVELNQRYGCRLQMGGSDQWGNIINGIDLGHRMGTPQLYALTAPLLTTSSGAKMGKSASGAVWLNADLLPVYDFWQYWRNTEDADVVRFLKLFTILRWTRSPVWLPLADPKSTRPRRSSHRSDDPAAWSRRRRAGCRNGPQDLRGRGACRYASDGRSRGQRAGSGHRFARTDRQSRARRLERRSPSSCPGRSRQDQRCRCLRRAHVCRQCTAHERRRHQAVAGQKEAHSDQACLSTQNMRLKTFEKPAIAGFSAFVNSH